MKIRLDAKWDLHMAALPNDENSVAQFSAVFREVAGRLYPEAEILVAGQRGYLESTSTDEENAAWQDIHDHIEMVNGRWVGR